jgi:hypothetical protein
MIGRSLETLSLRMTASNRNAEIVAQFLHEHPQVAKVHHLAYLADGSPEKRVYDAQCEAPGSTFSFDVKGGEAEAFKVLNALQIVKLAVSLGGPNRSPATRPPPPIPASRRKPATASASPMPRSASPSASNTPTTSWRIWRRRWRRWGKSLSPGGRGTAREACRVRGR